MASSSTKAASREIVEFGRGWDGSYVVDGVGVAVGSKAFDGGFGGVEGTDREGDPLLGWRCYRCITRFTGL